MTSYKPIDMHKKRSEILVIHCSDPRFQAAYRQLIDQLQNYYDLLVIPGASKPVVDSPSTIEYINTLFDLHHFKEVHIFDHIDCGAFGELDDEILTHSKYLAEAAKKISVSISELKKVVPHLVGEDKEIAILF